MYQAKNFYNLSRHAVGTFVLVCRVVALFAFYSAALLCLLKAITFTENLTISSLLTSNVRDFTYQITYPFAKAQDSHPVSLIFFFQPLNVVQLGNW